MGARASTLGPRINIPQAPATFVCAGLGASTDPSHSAIRRYSLGICSPGIGTLQCNFPQLRLCSPTELQLSRTLPEIRILLVRKDIISLHDTINNLYTNDTLTRG